MRNGPKGMALAVALGLLGAACGSGSAPKAARGEAGAADCHPELTAAPAKPLAVTVWTYTNSIDELATDFNRAQTAVRVKVEHKGNTQETANAYFSAAAAHQGLPDVVQLPGFATGAAVDTASVVPAQACIDASGYDLADFLPQTLATTKVAGTQWGMPAGLDDGEVLLYNTQAFARAGLDPARAPATVAELVTDARALAAVGVGQPMGPLWYSDELILTGPLTDADSGHAGRPTRAAFDTAAAREIYQRNAQMIDQGLAGPVTADPQGDLKAIGHGAAAMTIHPIWDLGSVATALGQGEAPGVSLAVAGVPTAAGPAGVLVRSNSLFLSRDLTAVARAGAWAFISWIEAPAQQARGPVSAKAFYFPDRRSAGTVPSVAAVFAKHPVLAGAWAVLANGPSTPIPAIGAHGRVVAALDSVLKAMTTHTASVDDALTQAARTVDAELAAYNADPLGYAKCGFRPIAANAKHALCP